MPNIMTEKGWSGRTEGPQGMQSAEGYGRAGDPPAGGVMERMTGERMTGERMTGERMTGERMTGERMSAERRSLERMSVPMLALRREYAEIEPQLGRLWADALDA